MIGRNELVLYLNQFVGIAVPHFLERDRYWWEFGRLIKVDIADILLKDGDRIKRIPINKILSIDLDRRGQQ